MQLSAEVKVAQFIIEMNPIYYSIMRKKWLHNRTSICVRDKSQSRLVKCALTVIIVIN